MKRFYCIKCKRIVRVRLLPVAISDSSAFAVSDRIGQCDFHNSSLSRLAVYSRKKKSLVTKVKVAPVQTVKSGRKGK